MLAGFDVVIQARHSIHAVLLLTLLHILTSVKGAMFFLLSFLYAGVLPWTRCHEWHTGQRSWPPYLDGSN
jgi:hypothetical protein